MSVQVPAVRIGSVVGGRYRILSVLGQGGMGILYVAQHTLTHRRVALKLLKSHGDDDLAELAELQARFLTEARTAAAVRHPNMVDVLDMGSDHDGTPFLAMELLEGISLDRLLSERQRLSCEDALALLLPVAGALATLHDAGIVHRDIKPSNIFLHTGARGTVEPKLLDFGLAQAMSERRLTRSGLVMGTPLYMAPEHAAGESVGPAADVWSLGVVLYECVAGTFPFNTRDRTAIAVQLLAGHVVPLSRVAPDLAPAFAHAIDRALRRDLSRRYGCMREFAQSLAISATICSIALPAEPDPVGLPSFQSWLSQSSLATAVTGAFAIERPVEGTTQAVRDASTEIEAKSTSRGRAETRLLVANAHWTLEESLAERLVTLRRSALPFESIEALHESDAQLFACLRDDHASFGIVVDMRKAPGRNDPAFENATLKLRSTTEARFARLCVLVHSMTGLLQARRLARSDGGEYFVTTSEVAAMQFARGEHSDP